MKKIYIAFVCFLFTMKTFSQNDVSAKQILNAVTAKMKNSSGIKTTFTITTKNRFGKISSTTNGKLYMKGKKYYIQQGDSEIFNDGTKNWNYNGDNEVTVSEAADNEQSFQPQKLLSGNFDEDFICKMVSSAGNYHQIQLTPKDKRKNFAQINLYVDKVKFVVAKAKVLDKSKTEFNIVFTQMTSKGEIPDSRFVFDKSKYNKPIEVIE